MSLAYCLSDDLECHPALLCQIQTGPVFFKDFDNTHTLFIVMKTALLFCDLMKGSLRHDQTEYAQDHDRVQLLRSDLHSDIMPLQSFWHFGRLQEYVSDGFCNDHLPVLRKPVFLFQTTKRFTMKDAIPVSLIIGTDITLLFLAVSSRD